MQTFALAFGLGSLAATCSTIPLRGLWITASVLCAVFVAAVLPRRGIRAWGVSCGAFCGCLLLGLVYTLASVEYWSAQRDAVADSGARTALSGTIIARPKRYDYGAVRIDVRPDRPLADRDWVRRLGPFAPRGIVRINCYDCEHDFRVGQRWRLAVRLKPVHGRLNPGGFDYERWAFHQRIVARGSLDARRASRLLEDDALGPVARLRYRLVDFIDEAIPPESSAGLVQAVAVGVRDGVSARQWEVFRDTGTGHLMAISGLHVGLVFLIFFQSFNWASRLFPPLLLVAPAQKFAATLALPPTVAFALLSGLSLPTQRATTMLLVFYTAFLMNRRVLGWHSFGVAALMTLLVDPLAMLSFGFWLSFGAVAALIVYGERRRRRVAGLDGEQAEHRRPLAVLRRWLEVWTGAQASVSLAVLPLGALFFGKLPLLAPLINLVAIPYFGCFVLAPVLAGLSAWTIGHPGLSSSGFAFGARAADLLRAALDATARVPDLVLDLSTDSALRAAVVCALIACFVLRPRRAWLLLPLGALAFALTARAPPAFGEFETTVLDVGQGLAVVLQTHGHAVVYDTGVRLSDDYDMARIVIEPFLKDRGVSKIDRLVLSHGDRDHVGGFEYLSSVYPPGVVHASETGTFKDARDCAHGTHWVLDGVRFEFLSPSAAPGSGRNDRSCVLRVASRHGSVLLTGDIEGRAERIMVAAHGERLKSDVLVVPHHGSRTSSSAKLLAAVAPELSIISRGFANRFGHPHPAVMERLVASGTRVLDTARDGAVSVRVGADGVETRTWRRVLAHPWRRRAR